MANRYWVGGSGTWNTTSTTNWSAASGGASGASVPTAADSVFFDQAGTYKVTCTGALTCLDITVSAGTVTFADGTTPTFAISGSMSLVAGGLSEVRSQHRRQLACRQVRLIHRLLGTILFRHHN